MHDLSTRARGSNGAVVVAGLFMAVLLAGALFFLAGIGRAVVQREALQDGADAVAFTAAVYHARGMNVVALLNVLPAAIILVLIGVKVIHGIAFVVRVAHCTYDGEACEPARAMEQAAITIETNVFPRAHAMLANLYATQNAIAVGVPWVAVGRSAKVASASGGPASFGVAVGPSLVGRRQTFLDPFEAETVAVAPPEAIVDVGPWPGLPLADATSPTDAASEWAVSCRKNIEVLDRLVREVIARYAVPITPSSEFILASLASGGLCGEGINQDILTAVDIDDERELAQRLYRAPKKVVAGAKLGSDHFAVWSVVGGHADATSRADRGVVVAAHGATAIAPPADIADVQLAKAEYYFEPASEGATWADIEPIAMWTLRWRARLRRVRPPTADVRDAVARSVSIGLATFASNRQAPAPMGVDAARARTQALRVLDAWFVSGAAGATPEAMNAWLVAQDGIVRPNEIEIVH